MSRDEEVVGVMFANYKTPHVFNIDEMSALKTFADYAAVAILNARHEERRHADQIKMVESISASLAHRMSNLAGQCRPAVQHLRERIEPGDGIGHRQLNMLERKADSLMGLASELVKRIKDAGSMAQMVSIPIGPLIEGLLGQLDYDAARVSVHREIPSGLPMVETVEHQLRQVISDLLDNAMAAVAGLSHGELRITVRDNALTKRVEIEISDNGNGIPDDVRDQLFTPGVTTKRETLGIGLWLGRSFMRATGGDVILKRSAPGEGASFLIEVPRANEVVAKATRQSAASAEEDDILIVDDDPDWLNTLADAVAGQGYTIKTASDYDQACDALAGNRFKLAVVDLSLEDDPLNRDGLELLKHIDEQSLNTRVVIVTGHGDEKVWRIARRSARFVEMINKQGLLISDFRDLVQRTLQGDVAAGIGR